MWEGEGDVAVRGIQKPLRARCLRGQHLLPRAVRARKEISCLGGGLDFRPRREWKRWLEGPKWPGRRAAVGGGREEEGDDMKERDEEWGQP